jgi:hypothetical protein
MTTTPAHQLDQCTNCGRYGWHTTEKCPDVPIPPGARPRATMDTMTGRFERTHLTYVVGARVRHAEGTRTGAALRGIDGFDIDRVSVQATAIQFPDGRVDDGSQHEPPQVYLGDDALTTAQARALAAALIETADEVDGWVSE